MGRVLSICGAWLACGPVSGDLRLALLLTSCALAVASFGALIDSILWTWCSLSLLLCAACLPVFGPRPVVPAVFASLDLCGCVNQSGFRPGDKDIIRYVGCVMIALLVLPVDFSLHLFVDTGSPSSDSPVRCPDLGVGFW